MISNSSFILYACIAKGTRILAEFTKEPDLEALAHKCIEKTPPNHSTFSHTVRQRTYTFVIEDPFVYFAIFDENIGQSEGLWFLNRLKNAFEDFIESGKVKVTNNLSSRCFQQQFDSVYREIMDFDFDLPDSPRSVGNGGSRNPSLDSSKGKKMGAPLLKKPSNLIKGFKKKKNEVDLGSDDFGVREFNFSVTMQKSCNLYLGDRQKAKQIWNKQVWVVLGLDLFVCVVLFGIWLWVCSGFKCMDG